MNSNNHLLNADDVDDNNRLHHDYGATTTTSTDRRPSQNQDDPDDNEVAADRRLDLNQSATCAGDVKSPSAVPSDETQQQQNMQSENLASISVIANFFMSCSCCCTSSIKNKVTSKSSSSSSSSQCSIARKYFLSFYVPNISVAIGTAVFSTLLPISMRELGESDSTTGLVVSLVGIGRMLADVPSTLLSHKIGPLWTMALSVLCAAVIFALPTIEYKVWAFFAAQSIGGLPLAGFATPRLELLQFSLPTSERNTISSHMGAGARFSYLVGPLIGGFVYHYVGERWAYLLACGFFVIAFAATLSSADLKEMNRKIMETGQFDGEHVISVSSIDRERAKREKQRTGNKKTKHSPVDEDDDDDEGGDEKNEDSDSGNSIGTETEQQSICSSKKQQQQQKPPVPPLRLSGSPVHSTQLVNASSPFLALQTTTGYHSPCADENGSTMRTSNDDDENDTVHDRKDRATHSCDAAAAADAAAELGDDHRRHIHSSSVNFVNGYEGEEEGEGEEDEDSEGKQALEPSTTETTTLLPPGEHNEEKRATSSKSQKSPSSSASIFIETLKHHWARVVCIGLLALTTTALRQGRRLALTFRSLNLGYSAKEVGYVMALSFSIDTLFFWISPMITNRFGYRAAVVPLCLVYGAAFAVLSFDESNTSNATLLAASVVFGIADVAGAGLMLSIISEMCPRPVVGLARAFVDFGVLLGPLATGGLSDHAGFSWCCRILAAWCLFGVFWAFIILPANVGRELDRWMNMRKRGGDAERC